MASWKIPNAQITYLGVDINTIMREKQNADYTDWPDSADFRDFFGQKNP